MQCRHQPSQTPWRKTRTFWRVVGSGGGGGGSRTSLAPPRCPPTSSSCSFGLQVPRLVARIAELEGELYCSSKADGADDPSAAAGGLLDRFGGLLRKAQAGLDAGISYV